MSDDNKTHPQLHQESPWKDQELRESDRGGFPRKINHLQIVSSEQEEMIRLARKQNNDF
jgi:hypothetical protein